MAYYRQATQANGGTFCPPRLRCSILLTIVTDLRIIFPSIPLLLPIGWVYPDAAGIWPGIRHNLRTMKPGRRVERETWIRCSQPLPAPCCGAEYSCCKHRRRCNRWPRYASREYTDSIRYSQCAPEHGGKRRWQLPMSTRLLPFCPSGGIAWPDCNSDALCFLLLLHTLDVAHSFY